MCQFCHNKLENCPIKCLKQRTEKKILATTQDKDKECQVQKLVEVVNQRGSSKNCKEQKVRRSGPLSLTQEKKLLHSPRAPQH